MPHIEDVLLYTVSQQGKPYILGAEADAADPDPPAWDCSELVQVSCQAAAVVPVMPDGAFWQYRHCAQASTLISVVDGIATRGALLFRVTRQPPSKFDDVPHVALSAGGGMTVEARGKAWGVGSWGAAHRFQAAALIPGCDYTPGHGQLPEEDELNKEQDDLLRDIFDRITGMHEGVTSDDGVYHEWTDKRGRGDLRFLTSKLKPLEDRLAAIEAKLGV